MRPGGSNEFVYSPIDVNATLYCVVDDPALFWTVDGILIYPGSIPEAMFNEKGIFQMTYPASDGTLRSNLTVYGDITLNNNISSCCVLSNIEDQSCTTLIIYGKCNISITSLTELKYSLVSIDIPSPPNNIAFQQTGVTDLVNISWTAEVLTGVNQTYKVTFDSGTVIETMDMYYVYKQSMFGIRCVAYVKAVNGAGESDPSNNVNIPSLPDIEPVTASLTHQVWKSNGHIMVNVSFKVSLKSYILWMYVIIDTLQTKLCRRLNIVPNIQFLCTL